MFDSHVRVSSVISGCASCGLAKILQLFCKNEPGRTLAILDKTKAGCILEITNPMPVTISDNDFIRFATICLFNCLDPTEKANIEEWVHE